MTLKEKGDVFLARDVRPWCYGLMSRVLPEPTVDHLAHRLFRGPDTGNPELLERSAGEFFFAPRDRQGYSRRLHDFGEHVVSDIIARADGYLAHSFDLLGSGPVNWGGTIDWQQDFKTGYRWPLLNIRELRRIQADAGSDIKRPWELSRFQHGVTLGRAYWLTADERYAQAFVDQFMHWTASNPPRMGVNWLCSMEVAIRLVNWIASYFFFRDSPTFTREVKVRFFDALFVHQVHIFHNLEFAYICRDAEGVRCLNGNHMVACLVGLVIPSILFPSLTSARLQNWAWKWFYREMERQICSDGVHHELSVGYHRLVVEMFLAVELLLRANGRSLPSPLLERLERMIEFVAAYTRPDGSAPHVRDGDDGRLFAFSDTPLDDHRYLLQIGAVCFEKPDLKAVAPELCQEALWWLGLEGGDTFERLPAKAGPRESTAYASSGFYFMRQEDDWLMALCAGIGLSGLGGHGHNDALSFELTARGVPVLVDPGTFVYTADADARNLFRSTAYHNTLRIDGAELNAFRAGELFALRARARPEVESFSCSPVSDVLVAWHGCYEQLPGAPVHRRRVTYDRLLRRWYIMDEVSGRGDHKLEAFFHFAKGWHPCATEQRNLLGMRHESGLRVEIALVSRDAVWHRDLSRTWVSERYGRRQRAWTACFSCQCALPVCAAFEISVASRDERRQTRATADAAPGRKGAL